LQEQVVKAAIERLLKIGLLETGGNKPRKKNTLPPHSAAAVPQDTALEPQEGAVEGNGTEHHHQEGNEKEKKERELKRIDRNGGERNARIRS
jgi:hypothetical protein